jgi:hypothetical protein
MATNAETISQLEESKDALQAQANAASGDDFTRLMDCVHAIEDEIDATEAQALGDADYVPRTDGFKSQCAAAQAFIKTLNDIKASFGAATDVCKAVDTVLGVIAKV